MKNRITELAELESTSGFADLGPSPQLAYREGYSPDRRALEIDAGREARYAEFQEAGYCDEFDIAYGFVVEAWHPKHGALLAVDASLLTIRSFAELIESLTFEGAKALEDSLDAAIARANNKIGRPKGERPYLIDESKAALDQTPCGFTVRAYSVKSDSFEDADVLTLTHESFAEYCASLGAGDLVRLTDAMARSFSKDIGIDLTDLGFTPMDLLGKLEDESEAEEL